MPRHFRCSSQLTQKFFSKTLRLRQNTFQVETSSPVPLPRPTPGTRRIGATVKRIPGFEIERDAPILASSGLAAHSDGGYTPCEYHNLSPEVSMFESRVQENMGPGSTTSPVVPAINATTIAEMKADSSVPLETIEEAEKVFYLQTAERRRRAGLTGDADPTAAISLHERRALHFERIAREGVSVKPGLREDVQADQQRYIHALVDRGVIRNASDLTDDELIQIGSAAMHKNVTTRVVRDVCGLPEEMAYHVDPTGSVLNEFMPKDTGPGSFRVEDIVPVGPGEGFGDYVPQQNPQMHEDVAYRVAVAALDDDILPPNSSRSIYSEYENFVDQQDELLAANSSTKRYKQFQTGESNSGASAGSEVSAEPTQWLSAAYGKQAARIGRLSATALANVARRTAADDETRKVRLPTGETVTPDVALHIAQSSRYRLLTTPMGMQKSIGMLSQTSKLLQELTKEVPTKVSHGGGCQLLVSLL